MQHRAFIHGGTFTMAPRSNTRRSSLQLLTSQWSDTTWLSTYLDADETEVVAAMAGDYRRILRKSEGGVSPATFMRLEGVLTLYVLARRVGLQALCMGSTHYDASEVTTRKGGPDGEDVGKAQERLRKALKELEDSLTQTPESTSAGLADLLRPLLKDTEGVLEEALQSGPDQRSTPSAGASSQGNGRQAQSRTCTAVSE